MGLPLPAEKFYAVLLFMGILAQCGCIMISHPDYPSDWPRIAKDQHWLPLERTVPSDITFLIDGMHVGTRSYGKDTLRLRIQTDLSLQLGFPDSLNPQHLKYRTYPTHAFFDSITVEKNRMGLLLRYYKNEGTDFMAVDFGRDYCQWSLLEDNSLLMKRSETLLGLAVLVIPLYGSRYEWVRITPDSILAVK